MKMIRKPRFVVLGLLLLVLFLPGCPKKIVKIPLIETPAVENPIAKLLETFSTAESFQAKASIRIDTKRKGQEMNFLLNGVVFYQRPDKIRILGYHPLGMGLFDALYRNGEFFLLIPLQKRVYSGEVSEFKDLIEKAGEIRIASDKEGGSEIPNRIRIEAVEKETSVELRLKNISINSDLPEDAFQWAVPDGVEVRPLAQLLKGKK